MNIADTERLIKPLEDAGWKRINDKGNADLLIFVTCSVRQKSEDKVYGLGKEIADLKKGNTNLKVLVTGCMACRIPRGNTRTDKMLGTVQKHTRQRLSFADYFLDINSAITLVEKLAGRPNRHSRNSHGLSLVTAYIPISTGCDNFCSYCVVPYTRGPLCNRQTNDIIEDVKTAISQGKKEIYLLGQNVNSYPDFPTLLSLINKLEGEYWIRFISSHPKDVTKKLIDVVAEGTKNHITPYLHFALQSGSDTVLKRMNRQYTYDKFKSMVDYARAKVPKIAITTDIIVGFPGETNKEFEATVSAMKECRFDMAYVSMYSPRPGTLSAETMPDDVPTEEKKKRWKLLTEILRITCRSRNKSLVGTTVKVLVESPFLGKTKENFEVALGKHSKPGTFVNAKISSSTDWSLSCVPASCCRDRVS